MDDHERMILTKNNSTKILCYQLFVFDNGAQVRRVPHFQFLQQQKSHS